MAKTKTDVATLPAVSDVVSFGFDASPDAIAAACAVVSEATGQAIQPGVYQVSVAFVGDSLTLPVWPVIDVLAVRYFDGNGNEHDGDPAHYSRTLDGGRTVLRAKPRRMWPNGAERADAITVTYLAGYIELPPGLRSMVANLL